MIWSASIVLYPEFIQIDMIITFFRYYRLLTQSRFHHSNQLMDT